MYEIKDREVEFPNRKKLTPVPNQPNVFDLQDVPGKIIEEGTRLNAKALSKFSQKNHKHTKNDVEGLQEVLKEIPNLSEALNNKANINHTHPVDTTRQATLVSGQNIRTVNGQNILGSGNIAFPAIPQVIDNLTSTNRGAALSANAGHELLTIATNGMAVANGGNLSSWVGLSGGTSASFQLTLNATAGNALQIIRSFNFGISISNGDECCCSYWFWGISGSASRGFSNRLWRVNEAITFSGSFRLTEWEEWAYDCCGWLGCCWDDDSWDAGSVNYTVTLTRISQTQIRANVTLVSGWHSMNRLGNMNISINSISGLR
ncbi:MAG: phage tail repeat domain-containing protein [Firmicutes bacterium]|nr:phage tail repeat domain-containing protein [Bacillota bacterium]